METKESQKIRDREEEWAKETLPKALAGKGERKKEFLTDSQIPVKRIYTPLDVQDIDFAGEIGFPGEFPYTRGVYPTMYRGNLWTMRQYAGFGTAEETNKRFKYLLNHGQSGLSVAFDLPTQIGLDSDHALSEGAVGKVGVAVDSLKDMEVIFDGIPLDKVSTSMTINAPASILLCMYIGVGEKQGVSVKELRGTTQNDILKEFISRGTYIFPPKPSMRVTADVIEYCYRNVPRWNTLSITGYHFREAGCDAVQEMAFMISDGIAYIEEVLKRGLAVDDFAPRLSYSLGCNRDFFEEIAKYRAARRLYARILRERFNAQRPESRMLRLFSGSCGSTLVAQQPENNIIRVAMHALMAILGGQQAIHTSCMDEGYAIPTEKSVLLALRTQQVLAYEYGLDNTVDPLGGSYFVESLTSELERRARGLIEKIDGLGGMVAAIEKGYVQMEIQRASYRFQKEVENGEKVVVGLNKFQTPDEEIPFEVFKSDPEVERIQKKKLDALRRERDNGKVSQILEALKNSAQGDKNLMPLILEAVKAYATLGEICGVLKGVFGEYKEGSTVL